MFVTPILVVCFIVEMFVIGAAIGSVTVALVRRSQIVARLVVRGAIWAGIAFLLANVLAAWADSYSVFRNRQRVDVGPGGEDLRIQSFIANHSLVICATSSIAAALLSGIRVSREPRRF